jgi:hypothetical protein
VGMYGCKVQISLGKLVQSVFSDFLGCLGFKICLCSTELFWGNIYGGFTLMRVWLCEHL